MASYLTRPRQQQRYYGNPPAPFVPGGGSSVGATMDPPMSTAPRTTGRAATGGGAMPFVPPPVVTNPRLTPFQLSLNNERAQTAQKAATFASSTPLPMSGGVYHGAFGDGPAAQKQAEGARAAFVGGNQATIDAQDLGPGIGVRSFSNKMEGDYAMEHPYVDPVTAAKANAIKAWSDNVPGSQAALNKSKAGLSDAQAKQTGDLTQPKANALNAGAESAKDRGKAAMTAADAKAKDIANKGNAFNKDVYRAGVKAASSGADALVAPHRMKLQSIFQEQTRLQSEMGRAIDGTQRAEIQRQIDSLATEETAARKAYHEASEKAGQMRQEATNPDRYVPGQPAQGGQGADPGASAAPAGGQQLIGHDPKNVTPESLQQTAANRGISVDEVKRRLGIT